MRSWRTTATTGRPHIGAAGPGMASLAGAARRLTSYVKIIIASTKELGSQVIEEAYEYHLGPRPSHAPAHP